MKSLPCPGREDPKNWAAMEIQLQADPASYFFLHDLLFKAGLRRNSPFHTQGFSLWPTSPVLRCQWGGKPAFQPSTLLWINRASMPLPSLKQLLCTCIFVSAYMGCIMGCVHLCVMCVCVCAISFSFTLRKKVLFPQVTKIDCLFFFSFWFFFFFALFLNGGGMGSLLCPMLKSRYKKSIRF